MLGGKPKQGRGHCSFCIVITEASLTVFAENFLHSVKYVITKDRGQITFKERRLIPIPHKPLPTTKSTTATCRHMYVP